MNCAICGTENTTGVAFCTKCGSSLNPLGAPGSGTAIFDRAYYGGFWRRLAGLMLDSLILLIPMFLLGLIVGLLIPQWAEDEWQLNLVSVIAAWLYFAFTQSSAAQASPGQRALNLKVTDLQGRRISFGRASGRHFASLLSALLLFIGYLMNLFTARRQTLHDLIAGTLVYRSEVNPLAPTATPPPEGMKGWQIALVALACMVPIVGILAAIAIPAYADYTVRAQVTEGINQAAPYKTAISEAATAGTPLNEISLDTLGPISSAATPPVQDIAVEGGMIQITFNGLGNASLDGATLTFIPALAEDGTVAWICGRGTTSPDYTPVHTDYAQFTSLPDKYMPTACR